MSINVCIAWYSFIESNLCMYVSVCIYMYMWLQEQVNLMKKYKQDNFFKTFEHKYIL